MSVGKLETEINVLLSIPTPALIAAFLIAFKGESEWSTVWATLVAVAVVLGTFFGALRRRDIEIEAAMHHFLFAHEWDLKSWNEPPAR
ncbi:MAG TPA: hypothetical protein VHI71_05580 [Actinomycetota bacterium]|nr:hypothetical protein [Actinomycetota bacterium]